MDELFGLIADAISKNVRQARAAAEAAQAAQADAQQRAILRASGRLPPPPPGVPAATLPPAGRVALRPPLSPRAPVAPGATPVPARALEDDIFATLATTPRRTTAPPAALLAAFAGGPALLGAIVLSEALAPPLALRQRER